MEWTKRYGRDFSNTCVCGCLLAQLQFIYITTSSTSCCILLSSQNHALQSNLSTHVCVCFFSKCSTTPPQNFEFFVFGLIYMGG